MHRFKWIVLALFGWDLSLDAEVRLPALVADHMVLQRDASVRIFGWADAGEPVSVRLQGHGATAVADAHGRWEAWLPPMPAGGPFEMTVAGKNTLAVRDVLVGEVWVASGQSNMVWPVERSNNADQEAAAADFPKIRLFKVELKVSDQPLDDVKGSWQVCAPDTVRGFSGVGYFFARHLHQKLGVPFGVIQSAWGGTPAEAWTSRATLAGDDALHYFLRDWDRTLAAYPEARVKYDRSLKRWDEEAAAARAAGKEAPRKPSPPAGPGHQHSPAGLFNAMIAPLTPYSIRGAIWYQGENNAGRAQGHLYRHLFESMIRDWRRAWGQLDFPFLFVQLANYGRAAPNGHWPLVQEAQMKSLELRGTGMAVTNDIGEADDIHPKNKQDVGLRLALAARALVYGEKVEYSGPVFRQATREGSRLRLWFRHAGGGLQAKGGSLKGFTIAGGDRRFHPAEARIEKDTVVVFSPEVKEPAAVRYAWANNPDCNLSNAAGLPASLFRTDDWADAKMPE